MFGPKKYKLLPAETVKDHGNLYTVHRIQALIDIPRHGVKAGDLGGYVQNKGTLSHQGNCWVGGNAIAFSFNSKKLIFDDSLVTDDAFVASSIKGACRVSGKARILRPLTGAVSVSGNAIIKGRLSGHVTVTDNVQIDNESFIEALGNAEVHLAGNIIVNSPSLRTEYIGQYIHFISIDNNETINLSGKLRLERVVIRGNCTLDGEFKLKDVQFEGNNTVVGTHQIKPGVRFSGENRITGSVVIPPVTQVHDVVMDKGVLNYAAPIAEDDKPFITLPAPPFWDAMASMNPQVAQEAPASNQPHLALIAEIEAEYEAYTTDVVKLIQYPAMVDTSIPEVGQFVMKLRAAKRAMKTGNLANIAELAESLELAFVNAENKVRTLVASHLDEDKKKSLKTAEKMLKLACDEASPESEKRLGFKAGMRELEGVIDVSDEAKDNLKVRIGLLELEA